MTTAPARLLAPVEPQVLRVASLGDSVSSGEGVGVLTPPERTWPALLAAALAVPGTPTALQPLARAGALVGDVVREQLPAAVAARPHVATVCAGLNDLVKSGCDPVRLPAEVTALVTGLRAAGATVVVTRLHDPGRVFAMPAGLHRQVAARAALVNGALDALAAADPGVLTVDLGLLADDRAAWAVDRVHPSPWGQALLAAEAARRLGVLEPPDPGPRPTPPTRAEHLVWLVRAGLPWLARRCALVGPPLLQMTARAAAQRVTRLATAASTEG